MATLAGNLDKIRSIVEHCYPGIEVGWIGNPAHQAEASDHNPDSRGVVHADDLMFEDDVRFNHGAPATLKWLLTPGVRDSLQYVIHDRGIWSRSWGWTRHAYDGTDPHTNHIHVSGKHGTVGKNSATGTGYDLEAEKMIPVGSPCTTSNPEEDMPTVQEIVDGIMAAEVPLGAGFSTKTTTVKAALGSMENFDLAIRNLVQALANPAQIAAAVVAALPPSTTGLTQADVEQAVTAALAKVQISVAAG